MRNVAIVEIEVLNVGSDKRKGERKVKDAIDLSSYQTEFSVGIIGSGIAACKIREPVVGDILSASLKSDSAIEIRVRELTKDKAIGSLLSDYDANVLGWDYDLHRGAEVVVNLHKGYWVVEN